MTTEAWRQRRISYYMTHARRCKGCGSNDAVELHHLSYANVYAEPDDDLMPLCQGCHAYIHIYQRKTGENLAKATLLALREMRRPVTAAPPKPVGRNDPNCVLFAAVRHEQAHRPTISTKRAREAGRLAYRVQEAQARRAEHAFPAEFTHATQPHQRGAN